MRRYISGVVFYLFLIWIPVFLFFRPRYDILVTNTTVIILSASMIGLLLDVSRFDKFSWTLPSTKDINKEYLERCIVQAFQIKVDNQKMKDKNYTEKVKEVADQIHEVFVRVNCPEEYQKIRSARLYPNVLSMTLFTILLFTLEWMTIFGLALAGIIRISLKMGGTILFIVVAVCALYVFYRGLDRVRPIGVQVTDFTIQIIRKGYSQCGQDDRDDFFRVLQERGLIVRDTKGRWKVREDNVS